MKTSKIYEEYITLIDEHLLSSVKSSSDYDKTICESMEYSLFTGGKRLRPLMTIMAYEMFDDYIHNAIPFALAIEMIHTYSLIHDDLPSMDNDDYRRGKLTNHKVYGEAMAILTGDALLNLAFETMLKASNKHPGEKYIKAMCEVSKASGYKGMIGGQVMDIQSEGKTITYEDLHTMYKGKTAALIIAAITSGAIVAGANPMEIESLRTFGEKLGLAYQIQDDLLDLDQDERIKKTTYLTFHSIEDAKEMVNRLSDEAIEILTVDLSDYNTDFFQSLTRELIHRQV